MYVLEKGRVMMVDYTKYKRKPYSEDEIKEMIKTDKGKGDVVLSNIGLVIKMANRYIHLGAYISLDDLIEQGIIGLYRAIDSYDPDNGSKFVTHAYY